jgi:3-dehydroquinate synthase
MTEIKTIDAGTYSICFENSRFSHLRSFLKRKKYSRYFILCDENTLQYCLPELITAVPELSDAHLIEIESGESAKSLEIATQIWNCLLDEKADRQSLLINLGGGVVTDLGGFCAAVFKRGINFIHIPTTLLAMADASVGAKTAIDFGGIKNSIE